jgi:hypothetical protein
MLGVNNNPFTPFNRSSLDVAFHRADAGIAHGVITIHLLGRDHGVADD